MRKISKLDRKIIEDFGQKSYFYCWKFKEEFFREISRHIVWFKNIWIETTFNLNIIC